MLKYHYFCLAQNQFSPPAFEHVLSRSATSQSQQETQLPLREQGVSFALSSHGNLPFVFSYPLLVRFLANVHGNGCSVVTATYRLKIANFPYPCLVYRPRSGWPLSKFWKTFTDHEARVLQVAECEDLVIVDCVVLLQCQGVTDSDR